MVGVVKLVVCGIGGVLCGFAACSFAHLDFRNFKVNIDLIDFMFKLNGNVSGPGCTAGWGSRLWLVAC